MSVPTVIITLKGARYHVDDACPVYQQGRRNSEKLGREEATDDPEEKNLIRRAAGAVGSISKSVMTDVLAAYVRQQTGL